LKDDRTFSFAEIGAGQKGALLSTRRSNVRTVAKTISAYEKVVLT
jgi:hypothetical protein